MRKLNLRKVIDEEIESLEKHRGIPHEQVMAKMKNKYPNFYRAFCSLPKNNMPCAFCNTLAYLGFYHRGKDILSATACRVLSCNDVEP